MVATPDLGSGAERRGGSSPFIRTAQATFSGRLFRLIKGLGQLVAPRQTCLWSVVVCYANIRVCCAIVSEKEIFATSPINPDNLRLQQPPFGLLSASAAVRVPLRVRNSLPPFEISYCVFDSLSIYTKRIEDLLGKSSICIWGLTYYFKAARLISLAAFAFNEASFDTALLS